MVEIATVGEDQALISTFCLGETLFGVDASRVQEIIRIPDVTPVYRAPGHIVGIINLRGRIVTVIDLAKKLSLPEIALSEAARVIIVEWGGEYVGLRVERVADVVTREREGLLDLPSNVDAAQGPFLEGVFQAGECLVSLLRVDAVLSLGEGGGVGGVGPS